MEKVQKIKKLDFIHKFHKPEGIEGVPLERCLNIIFFSIIDASRISRWME